MFFKNNYIVNFSHPRGVYQGGLATGGEDGEKSGELYHGGGRNRGDGEKIPQIPRLSGTGAGINSTQHP